jgi:hypothetical protein
VYNIIMKNKGRPPKPPEERRQERLDLRVSVAEKRAFRLAAANASQELSVWIRVQLLRGVQAELGQDNEGTQA